MATSSVLQIIRGKVGIEKYCLMNHVHFIRNILGGIHHSGDLLTDYIDIVW
jgi:hypothetical protein